MNHKRIVYSIVIPVFNESGNVAELYKRLKKILEGLDKSYEIIFADDGSTDDSFLLLRNIAFSDHGVRVLRFDKNYGQHKAVAAGILEAQGDYIVTLDADLQNPPEEIPGLIEKIKSGYDMVSGYRKLRKDSLGRRLPSLMTNFVIFSITGLRMHDYGSMLRIYKKETAKSLAEEFKKSGGYITMLVAKVTRNIAEITVSHDARSAGRSKYNLPKLAGLFFRILFCYNENVRKALGIKTEEPFFVIERKIEDGQEAIVSNYNR